MSCYKVIDENNEVIWIETDGWDEAKLKEFKKAHPGIRKNKLYQIKPDMPTDDIPSDSDGVTNSYPIKKPASIARNWCWTLNNYTSDELEAISNNPFRYLIYGKEIGENGTHHLQGYLELDKPMRIAGLKKTPGFERAHFEIRRGTRDEARNYCKKDGEITEYGTWSAGGQGNRTDWKETFKFLKDSPDFGKFMEEYPEIAIKYPTGVKTIINELKKEQGREALAQEFKSLPLYKWEADLLETLKGKPHDRKVIWIVDKKGGRGKTTFAKFLIGNHGAAYFSNGKSSDIAHNYHDERIAIFDYCRSNEERINYQAVESIKNGLIFSPKYDSTTKVCAIPHVICLSNFEPDRQMLSHDRWDIRELDDASTTIVDNQLQASGAANAITTPDCSTNIEQSSERVILDLSELDDPISDQLTLSIPENKAPPTGPPDTGCHPVGQEPCSINTAALISVPQRDSDIAYLPPTQSLGPCHGGLGSPAVKRMAKLKKISLVSTRKRSDTCVTSA